MSDDLKVPVYMWREAIRSAPPSVRPLTRLLCQTLSDFMDFADVAKGCYPNIKTLMLATGLSNRGVATHLECARAAGLIDIRRQVGKDGRFKKSHYFPRFPTEKADADPNRVKMAHAVKPSERHSRGPREPQHRNRVSPVPNNRVSGAHANQSKTTKPTTETRERAKSADASQCGGKEICLSRLEAAFDRWVQFVEIRDRGLADRMRGLPFVHVATREPGPNSPLPRLPAEGPSARHPVKPQENLSK